MKVLIVDPGESLWGSELVLLDALRSMHREELCVTVLCPTGSSLYCELQAIGVSVLHGNFGRLHLRTKLARVSALVELTNVIFRLRPDVVYVNQAGITRLVLLAVRFFDIPVVSHVRLLEDVEPLRRLTQTPSNLRELIFVSQDLASRYQSANEENAVGVTVAYDIFVSNHNYKPVVGRPNVITCVGRLAHRKGQDLLIRSLGILRRRGLELEVQFLGVSGPGDDFDKALKSLAKEEGVADNIRWLGYRKNPVCDVRNSFAVIVPSLYEALGRVIFEAWDAGVPVVACAKSGGAAEVIAESGGGVLYKDHRPECIAKGIEKLLSLGLNQRRDMVESGRQWVSKNLAADNYTSMMVAVLSRAVQRS